MKDKLRKSGCPENLSVEILGYSQGSVAANYGSGFAAALSYNNLFAVSVGEAHFQLLFCPAWRSFKQAAANGNRRPADKIVLQQEASKLARSASLTKPVIGATGLQENLGKPNLANICRDCDDGY